MNEDTITKLQEITRALESDKLLSAHQKLQSLQEELQRRLDAPDGGMTQRRGGEEGGERER